MSQNNNFNYMDGVPVKIAENYKPPPRVYQLPQTIINRMSLPDNHYEESPQYQYDFQLERSVIAKMSEWRRMRQMERDARQERKEKWEQQRLLALEAQHKQMLGAVSYPSAEDLSSSDSGDEEPPKIENVKQTAVTATQKTMETSTLNYATSAPISSNFNTILQPTILSRRETNMTPTNLTGGSNNSDTTTAIHAGNMLTTNSLGQQISNAFNYKDFEDDTSSPFDNIELKTINDLDVLAQVLHDTELQQKHNTMEVTKDVEQNQEVEEEQQKTLSEQETKEINTQSFENVQNLVNSNDVHNIINSKNTENYCENNIKTLLYNNEIATVADLNAIENNTVALKNVDFNNLSQQIQQQKQQQTENIPNTNYNVMNNINQQQQQQLSPQQQQQQHNQTLSNNYLYQQQHHALQYINQYVPNQQAQSSQAHQQQITVNYMSYNGYDPSQPLAIQYGNYNLHNTNATAIAAVAAAYNNQNYLYATNCNGGTPTHTATTTTATTQQQQQQQQQNYIGYNANNYLNATTTNNTNYPTYNSPQFQMYQQMQQTLNQVQNLETENKLKSKSVPDILKELKDEVHNSIIRRSAINSQCNEETTTKTTKCANPAVIAIKQPTTRRTRTTSQNDTPYYAKLEATTKKLAKNISSMGFPIERVAKIAQMFGADDKKIIEHLIPLSELMDLGFDESKISEALLKFDNNKEKALEYLIT